MLARDARRAARLRRRPRRALHQRRAHDRRDAADAARLRRRRPRSSSSRSPSSSRAPPRSAARPASRSSAARRPSCPGSTARASSTSPARASASSTATSSSTAHASSAGDAVIGFASAGVHANGFTLVRRDPRATRTTTAPDLLAPTRLYLDEARAPARPREGASRTSPAAGILGNLERVAPRGPARRDRLGRVGAAARVRLARAARRRGRAAARVQPRDRLVRGRRGAGARRDGDRADRGDRRPRLRATARTCRRCSTPGLPVVAGRLQPARRLRARACARGRHPDRDLQPRLPRRPRGARPRHGDLARGARRRARRARRLHAPADDSRSSTASRARSSTSTPRCCPHFPGAHAIEDALAAGVETTGVTVHLVDEGIDTGPVIRAGGACPVEPRDDARGADPRGRAPAAARGRLRLLDPAARAVAHEGADLRLRQARHRRVRARPRRPRLRARLVGRHGRRSSRSTGSTVTRVEEVTAAPEMLGGRVKTLHPRIHAGILARRDLDEDMAGARRAGDRAVRPRLRQPLSLRVASPAGVGVDEAEAIEMIDVGGPSMLRAAAKNFAHVDRRVPARAVRPRARRAARDGALSPRDAPRARGRGVRDDRGVRRGDRALVRRGASSSRTQLTLSFRKIADLAYGENPHQRAAYYAEVGLAPAPALARRAARRQGALLQQPRRPRGRPPRSCASSRCRPP